MHGQAHIPSRPGLERYGVHETPSANGGFGSAMLDARTGEVIWRTTATGDTGRGVAATRPPV